MKSEKEWAAATEIVYRCNNKKIKSTREEHENEWVGGWMFDDAWLLTALGGWWMVYLHLCMSWCCCWERECTFLFTSIGDHVPRSKMTMLPLNLMKHLFISSFHRRISSCYVYMFFCFSWGEIYKINRHTYINIIENTLMGDNKCMTDDMFISCRFSDKNYIKSTPSRSLCRRRWIKYVSTFVICIKRYFSHVSLSSRSY